MSQDRWEKYKVNKNEETNVTPNNQSKWDKYKVDNNENYSNDNDNEKEKNLFEELPLSIRALSHLLKSSNKKPQEIIGETSQNASNRAQGLGRGFLDIGEGLSQAGINTGESLGFLPKGRSEEYANEVDQGREFYKNSEAGKDGISSFLRESAASSPYAAPFGLSGSILKRLLTGAGTGASIGSMEFVNQDNDRFLNTLKGASLGAASAALPVSSEIIGKVASTIGKPLKWFKQARSNIDPLQEEMNTAKNNLLNSNERRKEIEQESRNKTGIIPKNMEHTRNESLDEIERLSGQEGGSNLPIPSSQESKMNLDKATESHESSKKLVKEIEDEFNRYVKKGSSHALHISSDANKKMEAIESHFGDSFKALDKELAGTQYQMPESVMSEFGGNLKYNPKTGGYTINKELKIDKKTGRVINEEKPSKELKYINDKAPTSKDTEASVFMAKHRDMRDARFEMKQKLKDPNISASEKLSIRNALKDSKPLFDDVVKTLHNGLGKHASEFKRINQGFSDIVFPLRSYKLAKKIKSNENLPVHFMKAASGESVYPSTLKAQRVMREILKSDPETVRHLIGQRYAGKINKLHENDELTQEYLDRLPKLKKILESHKSATEKVKQTEGLLTESQKKHESIVSQEKKSHKIVSKDEKRLQDTGRSVKELDEKIANIDEELPKLKKAAEDEKINLKNHREAKERYEKAKKEKEKAISKLKILGAVIFAPAVTGATVSGLYSAGKKVGSLANE